MITSRGSPKNCVYYSIDARNRIKTPTKTSKIHRTTIDAENSEAEFCSLRQSHTKNRDVDQRLIDLENCKKKIAGTKLSSLRIEDSATVSIGMALIPCESFS